MAKYYLFFMLNAITISLYSQLLYNNGEMTLNSNALVYVDGSVQNDGNLQIKNNNNYGELMIRRDVINNNKITNDGIIKLYGDWTNNKTYTSSKGTVEFNGDKQNLNGSKPTQFYNLVLQGNGNKTMYVDQFVNGVLNLTNIELLTKKHGIYVENDDIQAIERISGFISSDQNGFLSRKINKKEAYLFPVGSSVSGEQYRPVEITPNDFTTNYFTVRMAPLEATYEGYDINSKSDKIVKLNDKFYHQINRSQGKTSIDLSIYFDIADDGAWDGISYWSSSHKWDAIEPSNMISGGSLNKINTKNWGNFSETAYILHASDIDLDFPNVITPNGDGINDNLVIANGNDIPNKIVVFNRWGKKVFEQTDYQNDWDGGDLSEGTYYYIFYYLGKSYESSLLIIK